MSDEIKFAAAVVFALLIALSVWAWRRRKQKNIEARFGYSRSWMR